MTQASRCGGRRGRTCWLEPGDYLLLYTDGVIEARSPDGDLFGVPRLTDLMIRNFAAGFPASETMRRAVLALLEHQAGDLADDATMMLVQWRPAHDIGADGLDHPQDPIGPRLG